MNNTNSYAAAWQANLSIRIRSYQPGGAVQECGLTKVPLGRAGVPPSPAPPVALRATAYLCRVLGCFAIGAGRLSDFPGW